MNEPIVSSIQKRKQTLVLCKEKKNFKKSFHRYFKVTSGMILDLTNIFICPECPELRFIKLSWLNRNWTKATLFMLRHTLTQQNKTVPSILRNWLAQMTGIKCWKEHQKWENVAKDVQLRSAKPGEAPVWGGVLPDRNIFAQYKESFWEGLTSTVGFKGNGLKVVYSTHKVWMCKPGWSYTLYEWNEWNPRF